MTMVGHMTSDKAEITTSWMRAFVSAAALACVFAFSTSPFHAEDVAGFYSGRTVKMVFGFNPGGGYHTYSRLVARHIGKRIPGNPAVMCKICRDPAP